MLSKLLSRQGVRDLFLGLALLCATLSLMLYPQDSMSAAREGLKLCYNVIIPSLFPFFVLSALVVDLGLAGYIGRALEGLMRPLFNVPGACASAFVLGFVGGYPVGARTALSLYQKGMCTKTEAERLLSFCNNSGPAFLVGAAGVGVCHSAGYGLLLYGVHVLSAVIVGMLFAPRSGGFLPEDRSQIAAVSLSQALPEAVRSAVRAVLTVSGFVVTFSVVTGVLDASGLLPALVGTSAARLGLELHFARALCTGVLELGTGIGAMQGLMPTPANLALAAFLIGWGGVSVHCQTAAVIAGTDIKSARHTVGRLLHGAISALCMWVLENLF